MTNLKVLLLFLVSILLDLETEAFILRGRTDHLLCLNGFRCQNRKCIMLSWYCDGEDNCGDNSDEMNCVHRSCEPSEFTCKDTGTCIPLRWKCDREDDCSDKSDESESECSNAECPTTAFKCASGSCIPKSWVCDKAPDCSDGSDEENCEDQCTSEEFMCPTPIKCISKSFVCDGDNDCLDNSDEKNCTKCPNGYFRCRDRTCILANYKCDGDKDCIDASDEENCTDSITHRGLECSKGYYQCPDLITCIESSWVCNGKNECPDGADEKLELCKNVTCLSNEFKCRNNKCITGSMQCNGYDDCADNSDEDDCGTQKPSCGDDEFDCSGSACIPLKQVCDGRPDCPKGEDESGGKCGVNECLVNNGGCSQDCVDTPFGYQCECRSGFKMVGNITCVDIDECEDPSSCSQICINEKGKFKCECKDGYMRESTDHRRCKAVDSNTTLIFTKRQDIREISLHKPTRRVVVPGTKWAVALDVDISTGIIFWSDALQKQIYRANLNNANKSIPTISQDVTLCDGLAVDWIYKHLYWTDATLDTISMSNFDGTSLKTLITDNLDKPRAIALNPINGWMFWSDWGTESRIEKAGMDGSHRSTIVSRDIEWPNGITLDLDKERLYWIDAKLDIISSVNYDGTRRRTILRSSSSLQHPFSIAVFEDFIYWTDWSKKSLFQADKFNGSNIKELYESEALMVVHVNHPLKQPKGINYCSKTKCSHICLPAPQFNPLSPKTSCACPNGLNLMFNGFRCSASWADMNESTTTREPTRSTSVTPATLPYKETTATQNVVTVKISRMEHTTKSPSILHNAQTMKKEESKSNSGIVIAVLSILGFVILVSVLIYYGHKRYYNVSQGNVSFVNPLYRRTTSDQIAFTKDGFNKFPHEGRDSSVSALTSIQTSYENSF